MDRWKDFAASSMSAPDAITGPDPANPTVPSAVNYKTHESRSHHENSLTLTLNPMPNIVTELSAEEVEESGTAQSGKRSPIPLRVDELHANNAVDELPKSFLIVDDNKINLQVLSTTF